MVQASGLVSCKEELVGCKEELVSEIAEWLCLQSEPLGSVLASLIAILDVRQSLEASNGRLCLRPLFYLLGQRYLS